MQTQVNTPAGLLRIVINPTFWAVLNPVYDYSSYTHTHTHTHTSFLLPCPRSLAIDGSDVEHEEKCHEYRENGVFGINESK